MISESIHSIAVAEVSMDATSISNIKAFTCRRSNWNSVCPDSMIPIKGEDSEFDVLFSGGAEGVDLGRAEELEGAKLAHLAPVGAVLGGDEVFFVVEDVLGGLVAGPAGEDVFTAVLRLNYIENGFRYCKSIWTVNDDGVAVEGIILKERKCQGDRRKLEEKNLEHLERYHSMPTAMLNKQPLQAVHSAIVANQTPSDVAYCIHAL
nr:hypothetical protein Iba_chr02aCG17210 [Ipomoea batatas]